MVQSLSMDLQFPIWVSVLKFLNVFYLNVV